MAAKRIKKYSVKDDLVEKRLIRYLMFYGALIFILGTFSYLLDRLFHWIYQPNFSFEGESIFGYFAFYGISLIFPLSLLYNYIINTLTSNAFIRIVLGIVFCTLLSYVFGNSFRFGFYVGKGRELKNLIAFAGSGLLVELLRVAVVRFRFKSIVNETHF